MKIKTLYIIIFTLSCSLFLILGFLFGQHFSGAFSVMKHNTGLYPDMTGMEKHCRVMPEMPGCEVYALPDTKEEHMMMDIDHDPMQMSMADMGKMLEGKTGDALDTAFLQGMIPHHQGAIDMAKYLENSQRPELQELGKNIISAQQAEIEQMQRWLQEWNLEGNGQ